MKLHLYLSLAVIALAGCANGPGSHPAQSSSTATETTKREYQREEALNEAQSSTERMQKEVVMCQKVVAETHHLYEEAVARAQELYRESAPAVKQAASDSIKSGTVWIQKKLDEHTSPASQ